MADFVVGPEGFRLALRARSSPRVDELRMDYRGFVYMAAISLGAGLCSGWAPALRLARMDVNASLREGGRGSTGGSRRGHLSGLLVIAEMALAVVLLAGAGLMIRSFLNIYNTNTGVNPKNMLA